MYGWYLREEEKMKVAVCYIMAPAINRWRNQELKNVVSKSSFK
jgi:hypothetical protein